MTTRKPFSIRTQNELNISNKAKDEKQIIINELQIKKVSTKIIKVNTKKDSKVYINKVGHVESKPIPIEEEKQQVKKIEDIENHSPIEVKKKEIKQNFNLLQATKRKTYSIIQLLQLEPTFIPTPTNFDNWPEELKNPKPRESTPSKPKKLNQANLLKRSPLGEAINTIINNPSSIVSKSVEPKTPTKNNVEKSKIVLPILKMESLVPSSPSKSNVEIDERRLEQRQKQIDLGKKTLSYYMYCKKVPIYERKKGNPFTPRKNQVCSKRSWDGQVRKWRRMLHEYDPKTEEEIKEALLLFPEETKYLLQRKDQQTNDDDEENEDSFESDD